MKIVSWLLLISSFTIVGCGGSAGPAERKTTSVGDGSDTFGRSPAISEEQTAGPGSKNRGSGTGSGTGSGGGGIENARSEPADKPRTSDPAAEIPKPEVKPDGRKIIRNAELLLEADSPEETQTRVASIAEGLGGLVVESQQTSTDARSARRDIVSMTVRVPADKFVNALEEIRKTASRVVSETVKGQDVTEEFVDIEARLKAKRALEEQFMLIMKRASTVEDALEVQRELAEVRGEIEVIEGRKRFLENQIGLSTIKLRIQTPAMISTGGGSFGSQLTDAVNSGLNAAVSFVFGLITVVIALFPFLVIIVLPIYFIARFLWRKASSKFVSVVPDEANKEEEKAE
ncbi:MAG: DUF4349 domain-containing protein [Acidobacteria bacterium]|nr:DUF4349 domain-containing protein [Acidobacteriota bacterium]